MSQVTLPYLLHNNELNSYPFVLSDCKEIPKYDPMYKFWSAMVTNNIHLGDWLQFPTHTYLNGNNKNGSILYIRESYKELYDFMFNPNGETYKRYSNFIITGTPGIGKSHFAFYVMNEQLQDGKTIMWQHYSTPEKIYIFNKSNILLGNINTLNDNINNPSLVFLVDAVKPHIGNARTVLFVSPNRELYKEFEKEYGLRLYMPIWSWEEIELCHFNIEQYKKMDKDFLFHLYIKCGGVPRSLFIERDDAVEKLNEAVSRSDIKMIWHSLGAEHERKDASHLVIHLHVSDDPNFFNLMNHDEKHFEVEPILRYKRPMRLFASSYVADKVLNKMKNQSNDDLRTFLAASAGEDKAFLSTLRGNMFESYVHKRICEGGTFQYRFLSNATDNINYPLIIQRINMKNFISLADLEDSDYGIPVQRNFAAIDSLIISSSIFLFQITVSSKHTIQQQQLLTILEMFPANQKIYLFFVVPRDVECYWIHPQNYTAKNGIKIENVSTQIQDRIIQCVMPIDWDITPKSTISCDMTKLNLTN
jgi:hypothetical protein